MRLPVAASMVV